MKTNIILIVMVVSSMLVACQKEIKVDMPTPETKIVFEGAIENGSQPWCFVTLSTPYFAPFDSAALANLIVKDAEITVSDGVVTDTLKLVVDFYNFPFLKYVGKNIVGEVGKTYNFKAVVKGKTYLSSTTILEPIKIDSVKFKTDVNQDSLGFLWLYFKDPDSLGNNYRLFSKILGKDSAFVHPFPSVTNDKFFNGIKTEISFENGRNPLQDSKYDSTMRDSSGVPRWYFRKGQKVLVKLCSINLAHFDFWYSIEQQTQTDGNPFASPISARSNISNGALGVWGGYAVSYYTIDIPKK